MDFGSAVEVFFGGAGAWAIAEGVVERLDKGPLELEQGESVIRRDLVLQGVGGALAGSRCSAWMMLTTQRIVVTPMDHPLWFRAVQTVVTLGDRSKFAPARYQVKLRQVTRVWK